MDTTNLVSRFGAMNWTMIGKLWKKSIDVATYDGVNVSVYDWYWYNGSFAL